MFKEDPRFKTPDDTAKVWRYMDYDKFRSFIEENYLYFCSINTLKKYDPFEGSYYACKLLNEVDPLDAQEFARKEDMCGPPIAVNCWHLSEYQSMAMWKIYSGEKGIAIQTSVAKLKEAFNKLSDSIRLGEISYTDAPIDHPTGWTADKFIRCMTKRKCFEFEKEVRALVWDTSDLSRVDDGSAKIPIEINSLLENVYLSPESGDAIVENVVSLINQNNIKITPIISQILDPPSF